MTAPKKRDDMKIERWNVADLTPYELNSKKHDPDQVAKIATSILRYGFRGVITVDKHGVIIAGHGRRLALLSLVEQGFDQFKKAPVAVLSDLSPEEVKALRLADNRTAISDTDADLLRADLGSADFDLSLLEGIYDAKELDFFEVDLGAMNSGSFVNDMSAVVEGQKKDVDAKVEAAATARVTLAKAFGFKDVPGRASIVISRIMAKAEATTGKAGGDALADFLETLA